MRTITPIKIVAKKDEKVISLVQRAINNAYINSSIVKLIVDSVECLVYPEDNFNKIVHYVRLETIKNQIAILEAKG